MINLGAARRFLEAQMTDALRIYEVTKGESGVYNPATGEYGSAGPGALIYDGLGLVSNYGQEARGFFAGGQNVTEDTYIVRLPMDAVAAPIPVGSKIEVISSVRDPLLPTLTFRVQTVFNTSFQINYKMFADAYSFAEER